MQPIDERTAMLALVLRKDARWSSITEEVMDTGSARTVLGKAHGDETLFPDPPEQCPEVAEALALMNSCTRRGVQVFCFLDEQYPARLRDIHEMPPIVFTRGRIRPDRRAIAVVGSRKASEYGLKMAYSIAAHLASRDVTVVSGLAAGVDTAAHTAALDTGGRTVAVIGTGINRAYPRQNQELQEAITEHGMVISQFLPDAPPTRQSFPMRNAMMSGYAAATIVVEAGEHSGARIQARYALQHGRPLIFPRELLVNAWARDFAKRPGVYIVNDMDQMLSTVEKRISDAETTTADIAKTVSVAW
ncbi:MAG: DNA-protecting protein DprA [Nocardiopsaceae bacterium]|nr:DNA-protecting protein DprA [Nocardiopsaceae bacterium]